MLTLQTPGHRECGLIEVAFPLFPSCRNIEYLLLIFDVPKLQTLYWIAAGPGLHKYLDSLHSNQLAP